MKRLIPFAIAAFVACSRVGPDDDVVGLGNAANDARNPVAACGYCGVVGGRNDVKHLCSDSAAAWSEMVSCICSDGCAADCASDWCARLDDVAYADASTACNDCAITSCWSEVLSCSGAM